MLLDNNCAYLTGFIIGDGNLCGSTKSKTDKSADYRITIDIIDKEHLLVIEQMIKSKITTKSTITQLKQKGNKKTLWGFCFRNKLFFNFLNKDMQIPKGNKSTIVQVPTRILQGSKEIKIHFLAGYFDADGGFRSNTIGFTSASSGLMKGVNLILKEINIQNSIESWKNRKYNKYFYGIRIKKQEIDNFLKLIPLQSKNKLGRISQRFNVEVPERPNGID